MPQSVLKESIQNSSNEFNKNVQNYVKKYYPIAIEITTKFKICGLHSKYVAYYTKSLKELRKSYKDQENLK